MEAKSLVRIVVFIAFAAMCGTGASGYDYPVAIQRGNGLTNLFAKLNSGQPITIAYFGGSITQNPGWRDNVTAWFNSKYPGKITEVNAGWSGTGSLIGAMRMNRDVLSRNPDIVFVEFAVNDLPEDPLLFTERNSEGIVRQAWVSSSWKDICFIETIAWYIEQPYLNGVYPASVQAHYNVADRYGVPSINVGWALYKQVLAGTPWTNLAPDRVHPNATGSKIYSDAVIAYLENERTRGGISAAHAIPAALTDFPVMSGNIRDMNTVTPLPSAWSAHYNEFGVSSFVQSSTAGAIISLNFTGPAAAAKIVVAADSGDIQYSIDGGAYSPANVPVNGYSFIWAFPVAKTLANAPHTVTFRVASGTARIINVEAAATSSTGMLDTVPSGLNIAPQSTRWLTDSNYDSMSKGSKAIDGVISASNKWMSGESSTTHWLALDLGGSRTVNGFVIHHASESGEPVSFNTRSFKIQSASSINGPWSDECTVDNLSQTAVTNRSYTVPRTLRFIRLYITNPGTDSRARIPELEVRGTSDGMNDDTPVGVNLARQAVQWPVDSSYGPDWTGAKAIDGIVSGGSKWTSTGTSSIHWLALDLGSIRTVNGFIVRHAGAGGEDTYYNTKSLKIQSGSSINGPWNDECAIDNSAQANISCRIYNVPKKLRYIRLYIINSGIDNYARIPEFEVWGSSATSISSIKSSSIGTQMSISDRTVTAVFSDCFFIEELSRFAGIRCVNSGAALIPGDRVNVMGTVASLNGEKVLNPSSYSFLGMRDPLISLGFTNRGTQFSGPTAIGLYASVWGKVTAVGQGFLVVDDGSGLRSASGDSGIEVRWSGTGINPGDYVTASGTVCREISNGQAVTVVRAVSDGVTNHH